MSVRSSAVAAEALALLFSCPICPSVSRELVTGSGEGPRKVGAADDELPSLAQNDVGARALECVHRDMDGAHTLRPGDRRLVVARGRQLVATDDALGTHRAITQTRPIRPPLWPTTQDSSTTGNERRPGDDSQAGQHRGSSSSERSSPGLGNRGRRNRRTTPSQPNAPGCLKHEPREGQETSHEQSDCQDPPLAAPRHEAQDLTDDLLACMRAHARESRDLTRV
jgi:hypothetical protein